MVPTCLVWLIWRERNTHTFEDNLRSFEVYACWDFVFSGLEFGFLHNVLPFLIFFFLFGSLLELLIFVLSKRVFTIMNTMYFYAINL